MQQHHNIFCCCLKENMPSPLKRSKGILDILLQIIFSWILSRELRGHLITYWGRYPESMCSLYRLLLWCYLVPGGTKINFYFFSFPLFFFTEVLEGLTVTFVYHILAFKEGIDFFLSHWSWLFVLRSFFPKQKNLRIVFSVSYRQKKMKPKVRSLMRGLLQDRTLKT